MYPFYHVGQNRICTRCVMDTTDPEIVFDADGICNHCIRAEHYLRTRMRLYREGPYRLQPLLQRIRADGKGKRYDCIIGVSGGVDSTYLAYFAAKSGLRCLAVHFDNGWDSELAVKNIENTLKVLGIDLQTFVMDWEEFMDLQLAFLKASVPDIEVPTDHAIFATLYQAALHHGIKYILSGINIATESILPRLWAYGHNDWRYIEGIHKRFGTRPLRNYPHYSLWTLGYYFGMRGLSAISILNCIPYSKEDATAVLTKELGWRHYGGKHHESIITRFLQTYILPRKFNIDKRRAHLSSLVVAGSLTREAALAQLSVEVYNARQLEEDLNYVSKKFGVTVEEFTALMALPPRCFLDYPSHWALVERLKRYRDALQRLGLLPHQIGM